jgi:hypothetical protein
VPVKDRGRGRVRLRGIRTRREQGRSEGRGEDEGEGGEGCLFEGCLYSGISEDDEDDAGQLDQINNDRYEDIKNTEGRVVVLNGLMS